MTIPDSTTNLNLELYQNVFDEIRRKDILLEQIELVLYKMERLAVLAASNSSDQTINREGLQEQMERLIQDIDQLAAQLQS